MIFDLYFMPEIERALQAADPHRALLDAFERIQTQGASAENRLGYRQFLRFMAEVRRTRRDGIPDEVMRHLRAWLERAELVELILAREEMPFARCLFEQGAGHQRIEFVRPGSYRLTLDSGRVLWEGALSQDELLWPKAFPNQPIKMAADTDEPPSAPTREITLLNEMVFLRTFAGLETGTVEIEVKHGGPS